MEPMKPDEKARILTENPDAGPEELDEYERLLAERFATDPDLPSVADAAKASAVREARLADLHGRLFGQQVSSGRWGW